MNSKIFTYFIPFIINLTASTLVVIVLITFMFVLLPLLNNPSEQDHFSEQFQKGCEPLEYYIRHAGGGDASYSFLFFEEKNCNTELFIVKDWNLKVNENSDKTTFTDFSPPNWWPKPEARKQMKMYSRVDNKAEKYYKLWIGRDKYIYAETGRW